MLSTNAEKAFETKRFLVRLIVKAALWFSCVKIYGCCIVVTLKTVFGICVITNAVYHFVEMLNRGILSGFTEAALKQ